MDLYLKQELESAKRLRERCKQQYPDWKNDEYNCGPLKYIWGILSNGGDANNFYQLTDLDIYYNRDTKKYMLGIETIYNFNNKEEKIAYLNKLCNIFFNHIKESLDPNVDPFYLYMYNDGELFQANSETELYYKFKLFVKGFENL